jgi:type II secretory pathway pseudopilin PulG
MLELLVSIAIGGVLALVVVPSLSRFTSRGRANTAAGLVEALNRASRRAVARGRTNALEYDRGSSRIFAVERIDNEKAYGLWTKVDGADAVLAIDKGTRLEGWPGSSNREGGASRFWFKPDRTNPGLNLRVGTDRAPVTIMVDPVTGRVRIDSAHLEAS